MIIGKHGSGVMHGHTTKRGFNYTAATADETEGMYKILTDSSVAAVQLCNDICSSCYKLSMSNHLMAVDISV